MYMVDPELFPDDSEIDEDDELEIYGYEIFLNEWVLSKESWIICGIQDT